jgi:hypothetical protein
MLWNATFSFVLQQYPAIILASGINLYGVRYISDLFILRFSYHLKRKMQAR